MNLCGVLLWLLVGHAIADFWAQSDALAQMKNRNRPNTRVPPGQAPQVMWPYALTAHALMHGAATAAVLMWTVGLDPVMAGNFLLAEAASHWAIDFGKCENWYGIHVDQALHGAFKVFWVLLTV
jgi:hypothetical protein